MHRDVHAVIDPCPLTVKALADELPKLLRRGLLGELWSERGDDIGDMAVILELSEAGGE